MSNDIVMTVAGSHVQLEGTVVGDGASSQARPARKGEHIKSVSSG